MSAASSRSSSPRGAHSELAHELDRVGRLHAERRANPDLAAALDRLAQWQAARLHGTYADLATQERYTDAVTFFENDLYGSADFAQRDADIARVVPVMMLMLPESVIATMADAMELNALSHELDRALLERLPRADGVFTSAEYCRAYCAMGNRPARERQIDLIGEIGAGLDVYVRKPLIQTALVMMRQPARLAGLSVLHDFLERGFAAFHKMHGGGEFLATIDRREREFMNALFAGKTLSLPVRPDRKGAASAGGGSAGSR